MSLERFIETLRLEDHGRLAGNQRCAVIVFPNHSRALVPPFLAASVWRGMRDAS